jgi:hypothetical protein
MKSSSHIQRVWLVTGIFLPLLGFACAHVWSAGIDPAPTHLAPGMPVEHSNTLPAGLILPVALQQATSVEHAQPGQPIEARIMQDVPLDSHDKIPTKSRVTGSIVSVVKGSDDTGVELSLKFDKLEYHKQTIPIVVGLRAMAPFEAVRAAQLPLTGADSGTPSGWGDTVQIGGDIRFGDGGKVISRHKQVVGKGVIGGVLVHVYAALGAGCEGASNGDDRLQALWVFSSDACGVYGLPKVEISRKGESDPTGVITLKFEKTDAKLEAGTAMLLRVMAPK